MNLKEKVALFISIIDVIKSNTNTENITMQELSKIVLDFSDKHVTLISELLSYTAEQLFNELSCSEVESFLNSVEYINKLEDKVIIYLDFTEKLGGQ